MNNKTGLAVVKYLLGCKLDGQLSNLQRFQPEDKDAVEAVAAALDRIEGATWPRDVLAAEARAAKAYWAAVADLPVRFGRADAAKVPARWLGVGDRHSPLSGSPRLEEALAKLAETSRTRMRGIRAWEREHGKGVDRERYEVEVLPAISALSVPALRAATGLSQHYCWRVRQGSKRLHPMHWNAVLKTREAVGGRVRWSRPRFD